MKSFLKFMQALLIFLMFCALVGIFVAMFMQDTEGALYCFAALCFAVIFPYWAVDLDAED